MRAIIVPERVTSRSKAQIVKEAESTWLKPFIIEHNDGQTKELHEISIKTHAEDCHCEPCIQRQLDAIIAFGDAATKELSNASETHTTGAVASDELQSHPGPDKAGM